jgi:hypothetical protein
MRQFKIVTVAAFLLTGCASDQLSQNSSRAITTFGSVEQRLVLTNLGKFIDDPWTVPGHADFTSGVFQSSTQFALSGKFPLMNLSSQTREIDINTASAGDTDNWTLTPVTDSQDMRRLRALYNYAVCGNLDVLYDEFDESIGLSSLELSERLRQLRRPPQTAWTGFRELLDMEPHILSPVINGDAPPAKKLPKDYKNPAEKKSSVRGSETHSRQRISSGGPIATPLPHPAASTSNVSTSYFMKLLIIMPRDQWLYWTGDRGGLPSEPSCTWHSNGPIPAGAISLGSFNGHELFTTDRKAFGDFVLSILSALPNTVGYPASVYPDGGLGRPPKTVLSNAFGRFGTLR